MKLKWLGLIMLVGLVPALASAAEQANAPTATGETGLFTLMTGDTLPQGGLSFGLYYNNWDPLIDIREFPGRRKNEMSLDYHRVDASVGYGINDRWEVSVAVPYEKYVYSRSQLGIGGRDINVDGIGNVHLGTKFRLLGAQGDPSTLALNLFVEPSTGDKNQGVVSGKTGFGGGLGWRLNKWVIDVGYFDPGGNFARDVHAGLGYVGRVSDHFDWITEVVGNFYSGGKNDVIITPATGVFINNGGFHKFRDRYDFTTGGRVWFGDNGPWAFNFALRTDLAQLNSISDHCPLGGLLGLTYFPRLIRHEAPPPPPPPAPAPPERTEVTCDFTTGSARLTNICKAKLDEVGLKMKQNPSAPAQVTGYCNGSKGSAASNQRLADQRAQGVKNYLVTRHGIDPSRIQTSGQVTDRNAAVVVVTVQP